MTDPGGTAARRRRAWVVELAMAGAIVAVDQLTKRWITAALELHERRTVIEGFFDLTHVLNPGGVWGLGRELGPAARMAIFLAIPLLITLLAAWYSYGLPQSAVWRRASIALIVGGALGNLADRLVLDPPAVIDFLLFYVGQREWPAFNVADCAICVGFGILLVTTFSDDDIEDPLGPVTGEEEPQDRVAGRSPAALG